MNQVILQTAEKMNYINNVNDTQKDLRKSSRIRKLQYNKHDINHQVPQIYV